MHIGQSKVRYLAHARLI